MSYNIPLDLLSEFEKNGGKLTITEALIQQYLDKAYDDGFSVGINMGYDMYRSIKDVKYENYYDNPPVIELNDEDQNIYTVHYNNA